MTGQLLLHRAMVDTVTELPKLLGLHATLGPSHPCGLTASFLGDFNSS